MAGESPDRSKQRESSAELTSGSEGSVPGARDPRLAVSREKDSSAAVDTATKILSMRDVRTADDAEESGPQKPEEEQDSDLREAVSAWIRSAEGPEPESGSADTATAKAASPADEDEDTEAGPSPTADTEAGESSGEGVRTGAEPEAEAGTDDEAETDGDGDGDEEAGSEAGTGAEVAAEPGTTSGGTGSAAGGKTATGARAGDDADPEPDADPESGSGADAQAGAGDAADGPKDTEGSGAAPAEAAAGTDAKTGTGPAPAKADTDSDATADADEAAADSGTAPAKAGTGAKAAATDARAETGTAPAPAKADTDSDATADADEAAADSGTAPAKAGTGAKAAAATDAQAETGTAPAPAKAGTGTEAKGAAASDAKAAKVAGAKAAAAAARAAKGAAEAGGSTGEPEDTDGGDAPQRPPASDDERRTGGADGKTPAADGEAAAGAKGVDQPTTAFKAVRPKKPEVDQPTTMLKLGTAKPGTEPAQKTGAKGATGAGPRSEGEPGPTAPEAERTSRFVPLRDSELTAPTSAVPQVGPERTTQQPLPPKPPLDLLAELTNTPPPPETPVRSLVRRVKIWTPLVILLVIVFAVVQAMRPLPQPTLDLTAKESYTFDGAKTDIPWPAQGQAALDVQGIGTFGSSGTQKPVPIASVAKVMTAYIILRDHPLKSGADGPKIKIDQAAQDQSRAGHESTVDVTAGDSISQREALESILIASANNVARLLARWDVGSEKAFVAKMNSTAKRLGMTDTTYTDPSGLTNSTVSTAVDQVKLAKAAMQEPAFREVAAMMSYDDYKGVNRSNWNHLVGHNNVVGIKTGTTTSALGNLVFAAKQEVGGETRTIVGAVVRQPAGGSDNTILSGALDAADRLIRSAQGALRSATVLKKGDVVGYVDDGLGGRTPVVATKDVTAAGWSGLKVELSFASDVVPHTAKAGTEVGTLTVGDGGAGAVKVPVALQRDLAEPGFTDKLTRLG